MDDEVDLVEVIKIILKRKWVVFWIFIAAVLIVGAVSFLNFNESKKIVKTNTILEIGKADSALIEEPNQVAEKIKNNLYGDSIKDKLSLEIAPNIESFGLGNTSFLIIEKTSQNPEEDELILKELNNLILKEHQEKLAALEENQELSSELLMLTKVVKEPSKVEEEKNFPIKNFLVSLIIAGFIGILFSIFLCFVLEFWEKNKHRFYESRNTK